MFEVDIEKYAKSLLKWGIYDDIKKARKEAIRYNKKARKGLVEPLQCPADPDIEINVIENENGKVVEFTKKK